MSHAGAALSVFTPAFAGRAQGQMGHLRNELAMYLQYSNRGLGLWTGIVDWGWWMGDGYGDGDVIWDMGMENREYPYPQSQEMTVYNLMGHHHHHHPPPNF